jgi:hypothetical protein
MMADPRFKRVLAIDPFSRGVGFAVLEGPDSLIDWGLKATRRAHNGDATRLIESLIKRFQPDTLVLEDWNAAGSRRCERVERLLDRIATNERKRIHVQLVSPRLIRAIGPITRTNTKYGRACLLADRFPELRAFLPPVRKLWMPEDGRMAIFDALSFAIASFPAQKAPEESPEPAGTS